MPSVSKAQNAVYGASDYAVTKDGAEFTAAQPPGSVKNLPQRKNKRVDRLRAAGRISDKAAARFAEKE